MRLIDADEVQKIIDHIREKYVDTYNRRTKVNQFFWDTIRYIEKKVRSLPTIEVKPVVHGEWIVGSKPRCSVCRKPALREYDRDDWLSYVLSDFCPHCGADMRKKV